MGIYNDNINIGLDSLEKIDAATYKNMLLECEKLKDKFSAKSIATEIILFLRNCN